jgi:hypothetical protein
MPDTAPDEPQRRLFLDVLRRLHEIGVLPDLILIGSWCKHYYGELFQDPDALSPNKTTDIDFLIPLPTHRKQKIDLPGALAPFGFRVEFNNAGYMTLYNPELHIDFMVPEKGKGVDAPVPVAAFGVRATALRYMTLLLDNLITVKKNGLRVTLPAPANFALHKLLVSTRRAKAVKAAKDFLNGCEILHAMIQNGESQTIQTLWISLPQGWKKTVLRSFEKGLATLQDDVNAPRAEQFKEVKTLLLQKTTSLP